MPFSRLPGIVVARLSASLRRDLETLPRLDISLDGQRITNIQTRLEASGHQVPQFARSHGHIPADTPRLTGRGV